MKFCSFLSDHSRPIGVLLSGFGVWLFDVFTVRGLLVALGLDAGEGMTAVWVTRIVWWLLFYVLVSGFVQRLMWREAVLSFVSHRQLWAASHVDFAKRLVRRVAWWKGGVSAGFAQFRAHGIAMPWWRRIVGTTSIPAIPDVSRRVSEPADAVPAAA